MKNIKQTLLATAFVVAISATSAQAATFTNEDDGVADNLTIDAGTVDATDLGTDSVAADEIATGAVGTDEISNGSIGLVDLGANSVDSSKISDGTVGRADLSSVVTNQLDSNTTGIANLHQDVEELRGGVAMGLAMANIPGVPRGKQFAIGIGAGTYDGESAGALKLSYAPKRLKHIQVNASVGFASETVGGAVGMSYGF